MMFRLGTTLHCAPSQCKANVWGAGVSRSDVPTAHTSLAEAAAKLARELSPKPAFGEGTMLHFTPSQCKMRV